MSMSNENRKNEKKEIMKIKTGNKKKRRKKKKRGPQSENDEQFEE